MFMDVLKTWDMLSIHRCLAELDKSPLHLVCHILLCTSFADTNTL